MKAATRPMAARAPTALGPAVGAARPSDSVVETFVSAAASEEVCEAAVVVESAVVELVLSAISSAEGGFWVPHRVSMLERHSSWPRCEPTFWVMHWSRIAWQMKVGTVCV